MIKDLRRRHPCWTWSVVRDVRGVLYIGEQGNPNAPDYRQVEIRRYTGPVWYVLTNFPKLVQNCRYDEWARHETNGMLYPVSR